MATRKRRPFDNGAGGCYGAGAKGANAPRRDTLSIVFGPTRLVHRERRGPAATSTYLTPVLRDDVLVGYLERDPCRSMRTAWRATLPEAGGVRAPIGSRRQTRKLALADLLAHLGEP